MNDGFLVDVPGLGQLIASLSEAADRMRAANNRLRAASATELGSVGLDWAAGEFQGRWEYGLGKISDASEKMADSLREAKLLYEQLDQAIARLFPDPGVTGSGTAEPGEPSPISRALDGGSVR
ncbi:MAG: WXG100 family type VII secretion target [Pseudonocardiaceae bacterium]